MCLSLVPVGASATTSYLKGDVNGDGVVNGTDSLALANFLNGKKAVVNGAMAERMDIVQNYVIDENDLKELKNIILGTSNSTTIPSTNQYPLPTQDTKREYRIYNAQTGSYNANNDYSLTATAKISTSSTYSIVDGTDGRYTENDLKGVVKVGHLNDDGTLIKEIGTGFVVDSHTILTAAHCVNGQKDLRIVFYNDSDTVDYSMIFSPVSYHIPKKYLAHSTASGSENYLNYDYALITVNEDLSDYALDLGVIRTCSNFEEDIYVTGFGAIDSNDIPNYPGVNTSLIHGNKYSGKGELYGSLTNWRINYTTDILPGNSGGPIYIKIGTKITVIGICAQEYGTYNSGIRITTDLLHFIYNNSNLS